MKSGHFWVQQRAISMVEPADAEKWPNAWISAPTEKPLEEMQSNNQGRAA
ncbi:hypothetical protein [Variovorax sp. EL159]|nr:hypothetical protein [Variovorax sp. EL159]